MEESGESLGQIPKHGAAKTSINKLNEPPIRLLNEESVYPKLPGLVDDYSAATRIAPAEQCIEHSGLPGPEEAREDSDGNPISHSDSAHAGGDQPQRHLTIHSKLSKLSEV